MPASHEWIPGSRTQDGMKKKRSLSVQGCLHGEVTRGPSMDWKLACVCISRQQSIMWFLLSPGAAVDSKPQRTVASRRATLEPSAMCLPCPSTLCAANMASPRSCRGSHRSGQRGCTWPHVHGPDAAGCSAQPSPPPPLPPDTWISHRTPILATCCSSTACCS